MKKSFFKATLTSALFLSSLGTFAEPISKLIPVWQKIHGMLIFSVPVKIGNLDPRLTNNAHNKFTLPLVYESLITVNSQQQLQPVLAKSWKISSDERTVTISIKHEHRFSDGSEVTAADVSNSLLRLCSKGSQEYGELSGLTGCVSHAKGSSAMPAIQILDKYTLKFTINSSPTTFLYQLSSPVAVITKQTKSGLIGSAPYRFAKAESSYTMLTKNPFYLGTDMPKNDGVVLFYQGGQNIKNVLVQNQPDGALMYRMQDFGEMQNSQYKLIRSNPNITEILVLNNQRYPFNIPLVRKALANEIYNNFNKQCIVGSHQSYGLIPNGIGGSINNIAPEKLREINPEDLFSTIPQLKEHTSSVTLHQLYDLRNDCEAKQIMQAGKKYNIDIKFKYHKDYSDLLPLYQNHNLDGFLDLYVFKNREAYKIFEFFAQNGENDANLKGNSIDTLLSEAASMPSSHGRFQIYRKLAQFMQDNNFIVPIFYMDHGNLIKTCLNGISNDFFFNPFSFIPQLSKTDSCFKSIGVNKDAS